MRSKVLCGLWVAAVCLMMLSVPAFAYSETTTNGGNGGLGNGMGTSTHGSHEGISANQFGTGMHVQSYNGTASTRGTHNHEVSIYGTGTGSQFFNVNSNASASVTTERNLGYHAQSYTNDGYRALETNSSRGKGWGWLGLIGLFGIFKRNPQRDR
ncbi:hypothetical protein H8B09_09800 [Paenibacillus sp. PR3]|uniref:Uncharacterized protein n=1 Tax=Paenibacillus terricola TaxID=2763503 RepID=A0ABR8MSU9_9BACL|nr:WGxxGxxG family protein [Paenibacillus terricola]MBD3919047.1 hypothetical protein [Paenibacillus terricola]